jgi:hypothetical protein
MFQGHATMYLCNFPLSISNVIIGELLGTGKIILKGSDSGV